MFSACSFASFAFLRSLLFSVAVNGVSGASFFDSLDRSSPLAGLEVEVEVPAFPLFLLLGLAFPNFFFSFIYRSCFEAGL